MKNFLKQRTKLKIFKTKQIIKNNKNCYYKKTLEIQEIKIKNNKKNVLINLIGCQIFKKKKKKLKKNSKNNMHKFMDISQI